jgi:hypothetical protein
MSYVNLNNPANFQLQEFEQLGFRYIVTGRPTIGGETYRTIFVLTDAVVTATCPNGDSLSSETLVAGTVIHGFFEDVSVASGSLLAYKAGPITAQEIFDAYKAYVYAQGGIVEGESCAVADIAALLEDKLYSAASLVLIPSGYKVSHLYAERPLDSNGDFTFTRASSATRVGPNGLIEKVRTNLALYSQDLSQTGTWFTSATTRVDSQTDPNGGTTASKFTATGANSNVIQTLTVSSGIPYTWSFYAKSDSATDVNIRLDNNNGNFVQANMALTTSWQRFSITLNSNATTILCFLGGGLSFATGEVAYMAFAQLESGDIMTDYIATTTAAVSVGPVANLPRIDYTGGGCGKLLLEPQRTNVITFSEQFTNAIWDNSSAVTRSISGFVSPQGVLNAYDIIPTTANANHTLRAPNLSGFTSGAVVSVSFFAKANGYKFISVVGGFGSSSTPAVSFNVEQGTITSGTGTIEDYGNGWYRCSLPITLNATSLFCVATILDNNQSGSFAGDGTSGISVYGFQIEVGSYSTSYIPTLGAASTRGADACIKTGIASLIGQSEGTIFLDFIYKPVFDTTQTSYRASISDGTYTNRVSILAENSNTLSVVITGVSLTGSTFPIVDGQRYKVAIGYGATTDVYINGAKVYSYSGGTPTGTYTRFQFSDAAGLASRAFAGPINQALLFKTRLTNAQLAALTTP